MADLRLKSEYVGPGEQKTAEKLRDDLPNDWVIYVGRKLAGANRDDVDLIVVGKSLVFVLEEKSWGPRIVVDDNNWYVGNSRRANPLNRVGQVARKIAGLFREHVSGYEQARGRRGIAGVVLSHDNLTVLGGSHHDASENVLPLRDAADELVAMDDSWDRSALGPVRHRLIAYLDDLPDRSIKRQIGDYFIDGELESAGVERAYAAHTTDGEHVVLKCYPMGPLRQLGDPLVFLARERLALAQLADVGRTWTAYPAFQSEEHDFFVVPVVPPQSGRSLEATIKVPGPERPGGVIDDDIAHELFQDAFTALRDVHEHGLVHRALHPRRVWLGRQMRVLFSEFHLARMEGAATVRHWVDHDISEEFRAPECAADVGLASDKSDVYSLALCLCTWLLNEWPDDTSLDGYRARVTADFPWAVPVLAGLSASSSGRPTAAEMVEALTPAQPEILVSEDNEFHPGSVIDGRYEVLRTLGTGGYATSWLVHDKQAEQTRVLKEFHEALPAELRAEFRNADKLKHERCGRVYDIQVDRGSPYLVSGYVEGESLASKGTDRSVDEVREIALGILEALEYIHSKDLIHGDITPANIIVSTDGSGQATLIDFGLAVQTGAKPVGLSPKFAAPEVHGGQRSVPASDIYGVAASLTYALLGRSAARVEAGELIVDAATPAELEPWGDAGELLLRPLMRALVAHPDARPTARELSSAIRGARSTFDTVEEDQFDVDEWSPQSNPNVSALRRLYRGSSAGNAGNRGLDDPFAVMTYVPTLLDTDLVPKIVQGDFDLVLLSGNPGDGKTSVLVKIGEELLRLGAAQESSDEAGWQMRFNDRLFLAVFDASEAHGDLSSDDLVKAALDPLLSGTPATALIAVNDGRLLQFMDDHDGEYEELWFDVRDQVEGRFSPDSRVALVDLKRRSLASLDRTSGLANQALSALTKAALWETCGSCSSQHRCPILSNRNLLASAGSAGFGELMLASHLRRRRRATFRDVRSAAGWLITGDRDCADIHEAEKEGLNPLLIEGAHVRDLAFAQDSNDYLIDEWSGLDPSAVAAPEVDRLRRTLPAGAPLSVVDSVAAVARALYVRELDGGPDGPSAADVLPYRYLGEFVGMLQSNDLMRVRNRLLLGISRLVGAFGFASDGLAMSSGMAGSSWAILHTVPVEQFTVIVPTVDNPYVETIPDRIVLAHDLGPRIALTLDTAEIILRAADGELVDDPASDATLQEIDSFVSQLARQPSSSARIVDTSGSVALVNAHSGRIVLEGI